MNHLRIEHPRRRVCCKFGSVLYLLGSHWFSPFEDIDVQRKFLSCWRICLLQLPVGVPKIQRKLVLFERTSRVSCQLAGSNKVSGLHGNLSAIALPLWVWRWCWTRLLQVQCRATIFHANHLVGCPSSWTCDERVPYICQEYATAIRRHEENSSHLLQRNAVPEQSSKAHIPFGKVERCIWDRFQTWVHPGSGLMQVFNWTM